MMVLAPPVLGSEVDLLAVVKLVVEVFEVLEVVVVVVDALAVELAAVLDVLVDVVVVAAGSSVAARISATSVF